MFTEGNFITRIEVLAMFHHSIIGEELVKKTLKQGGLSPEELERYANIAIECKDIIEESFTFPGIPVA